MHEYRIEYVCENGFEGEVTVMAANRTMAFEMFADFGIKGIVSVECYRVMEDN